MPEDNRDKWRELPEITINNRKIAKHARRIESATVRHAHKFIIRRWGNVVEVRKLVITWVLIMAVLVGATGLQLMWARRNYITNAQANNGTYAEAVLGPIDNLNPIYAVSSAEKSASRLMFSSLLKYDTSGRLNFDLATHIQADTTGKIYTISIRPDAKWQDGHKLTSSDIIFTINLIKNANTRSVINGWDDISAKKINDQTVELTLKSPYAAFKHVLTFPVLPEHLLSKVAPANLRENNFSQQPVGSGLFKFKYTQSVDTNSGEEVIYMTRNDNYYGGLANLVSFQLHSYGSGEAILSALSKNVVNSATDITPLEIDRIGSNRYTVSSVPIQSGVYAIINMKSQILSDQKLRQVLQIGTDTQSVRKELPDGTPNLYLPFTNGQLTGGVPTAPIFNQKSAMQILEDTGWKVGSKGVRVNNGKELKINVVTMKSSELERVLEVLSGQWRALGFDIQAQVVDPEDISQNVAQSILQPRNYDVLLYRLDIGADPDVFAYWHSSQISNQGLNFANYQNDVSDSALLSARGRLEPDIRNAKYLTFAKQWLNDIPAIGLYQTTMQYARSASVQTFDTSNKLIYSEDRYSDILNWSRGERTVYKTP